MFVSVYCKLLLLLPIRKFNDAEERWGGGERYTAKKFGWKGRGLRMNKSLLEIY